LSPDELRRHWRDPLWFVPRLTIVDDEGQRQTLRNMWAEQRACLEALTTARNVLVLKSRQLGITTIVVAFLYHQLLCQSGAYSTLSIGHERDSCNRVNGMVRQFWKGTPSQLQPDTGIWNSRDRTMVLPSRNGEEDEASMRQIMAGGRGSGRSFSYQALHATEMGLWPRGTSAQAGSGGSGGQADKDIWAAALSTMRKTEHSRMIVESTAKGPGGHFHHMCRIAQRDPAWKFLFFPWFNFVKYREVPPDNFERTDEEEEQAALHGLDDTQLSWRRSKIETEGYGLRRFREEFPATPEEPFLLGAAQWFDCELLNKLLSGMAPEVLEEGLFIFREPEPGRKYFAGGDTSGGTGNDEAALWVVDDALRLCGLWASRYTKPRAQARAWAMVGLKFGACPILVEKNKYGKTVIDALELDIKYPNLWSDMDGKDWFTNQTNKRQLYSWGQELIDGEYVDIPDMVTIQQLMSIREVASGNIEAPGDEENDDRPDALMLALWCARTRGINLPGKGSLISIMAERGRRARALNTLGRLR